MHIWKYVTKPERYVKTLPGFSLGEPFIYVQFTFSRYKYISWKSGWFHDEQCNFRSCHLWRGVVLHSCMMDGNGHRPQQRKLPNDHREGGPGCRTESRFPWKQTCPLPPTAWSAPPLAYISPTFPILGFSCLFNFPIDYLSRTNLYIASWFQTMWHVLHQSTIPCIHAYVYFASCDNGLFRVGWSRDWDVANSTYYDHKIQLFIYIQNHMHLISPVSSPGSLLGWIFLTLLGFGSPLISPQSQSNWSQIATEHVWRHYRPNPKQNGRKLQIATECGGIFS
jgi:hypothetical protein